MAVISTVKLSELTRHKRIDADRYHTDFLALEVRLKRMPMVRKLSSLIVEPVKTGHTPAVRDIREDDEQIYFVKTDTLRQGLIDFENSDFLPARVLSERDYLRDKDVIVTIIGAHYEIVGRSAVFMRHHPKSTVNQNIAVIRPDENLLSPFYFMVFLNSRYGREQLWMLSRQTEQVNLNCREVEELLVPVFDSQFQCGIEALVIDYCRSLEKSNLLYSQAENLLLEELRLKNFKLRYELCYSASLSKAFGAHRVDAEYFHPLYEDLMKVVAEKCSLISLGTVFNFNRGIFIPTDYYTDEKTNRPYIRIKELSGRIGIEESKVVFIKDGYPQDKNNQLKENDLVVAIIGDTIGKTNRISMELAAGFCSNNMGRLRIKPDWANRILPEFAELAFQSLFIQRQVEQGKAQTGQPKISDFEIRAIKVPMPAIETQKEIASLIQQSHGARRKAKELLEEAKSKVENLIEGKA